MNETNLIKIKNRVLATLVILILLSPVILLIVLPYADFIVYKLYDYLNHYIAASIRWGLETCGRLLYILYIFKLIKLYINIVKLLKKPKAEFDKAQLIEVYLKYNKTMWIEKIFYIAAFITYLFILFIIFNPIAK